MDGVEKLFAILIVAAFAFMGIGLSYAEHVKSECRIAAIQAGRSADEIAKLCY